MLNLGYPLGLPPKSRGPFWVMTVGYNLMLVGFALWLFLDWRYLVVCLIIGGGNLLVGVMWFAYRLSKDLQDDTPKCEPDAAQHRRCSS